MSVYCGTDIIEVARIKDAIENVKEFKQKIYSKNEIEDIEKSSNNEYKYQRYAGRFAAKEAIYKALSEILIKNKLEFNMNEVEILNNDSLNRRPKVLFVNERIQKIIDSEYIKIDISISHIKENAIAMAVVKGRDE